MLTLLKGIVFALELSAMFNVQRPVNVLVFTLAKAFSWILLVKVMFGSSVCPTIQSLFRATT